MLHILKVETKTVSMSETRNTLLKMFPDSTTALFLGVNSFFSLFLGVISFISA